MSTTIFPSIPLSSLGGTLNPADIYVRKDGNDNNLGTIDAPLLTTEELARRVPEYIRDVGTVFAHLGDGKFMHPFWGTRLLGGKLTMRGDGAGIGDGFARIQTEQTCGAGTTNVFLAQAGGGLTPDDPTLFGRTLQTLTGPGAGQLRHIKSNTAGGYIPSRIFFPAIDDTTTFEIVTCKTEIEYPGFFNVDSEIQGTGPIDAFDSSDGSLPSYVVAQCRFVTDDFPFTALTSVQAVYYGIEIGGTGTLGLSWNGCSTQVGSDDFIGDLADVPVVLDWASNNTAWLGWGFAQLGAPGVTTTLLQMDNGQLQGYFCMDALSADRNARINIFGGRLRGPGLPGFGLGSLQCSRGGNISVFGASGNALPTNIEAVGSDAAILAFSTPSAVTVSANVVLAAASGALLRAQRGGFIELFSDEPGASATGKAVDASGGGKIYINGAPVLTSTADPATAYTVGGAPADVGAAFFAVDGTALTSTTDNSIIQRTLPLP